MLFIRVLKSNVITIRSILTTRQGNKHKVFMGIVMGTGDILHFTTTGILFYHDVLQNKR